MSDEMATKLKWRLFYVVKAVNIVLVLTMILGSVCLFAGLMWRIVSYKNSVSCSLASISIC